MSKVNRRCPQPGSQRPTDRPTGDATPNPSGEGTPPRSTGGTGPATSGTTSRPTTTAARHGRRERSRTMYQPSFMERNRTPIVAVAAIAGVALLAVFVFFSASQPAYACSTIWTPPPTASPAPSATPNLGYVQPDMGNTHVNPGTKVTYTYCAPASGDHYNKSGIGPITARVYGPGDNVIPQGWIHNLEHGGMVILYQGTSTGATTDGQTQLKALFDNFPVGPRCGTAKGLVGPTIARFDQMSTPFQAILWGRVLPLQTLDTAQILAFWNQWGERTNPEDQCPTVPRTTAAPSGSAAPSSSPSSAPSGSASPTAAPTSAPSGSAAPSPS